MAVTYKDYYKLLGVARGAGDDEIAKAFKKQARKYHPDLNPGNKQAEEKFKEINEAYEVLKDPQKRRLYDQLGPDWQQGQAFNAGPGFDRGQFHFEGADFGGSGFSDFFETLFGGRPGGGFGPDPFGGFSTRPRKGRDVESELRLSLEDALHGGRREVTLKGQNGVRTLEVNVPAGIRNGAKMRLAGQGESLPGGTPGDLYLKIRYMQHPVFRVDGSTLECDIALAAWEAALGARVEVPTLEGKVELNIPAGTSSGRKFRLKGKGLGPASGRGDLLVRAMIRMPASMTDEELALWKKMASASPFKARA